MSAGPYSSEFLNTPLKDVPRYLASNFGSYSRNTRAWYRTYYFQGNRAAPLAHLFFGASFLGYCNQNLTLFSSYAHDGDDIFHHSGTKYHAAPHADHDWS